MKHESQLDRVRSPIPSRELERRWELVRKAMLEQEIDLLIMQNDNQFLGGYVRYFIDNPAQQAYPATVMFPIKNEMIVITSGGDPAPPLPPEWASRGIGKKIALPYFRSMDYTNHYDAKATVKVVKELNCKKVGFIGLGMISAAFHQYVIENLPSVEFVNATDLVDEIKAIKSPDELVFIRKSVEIHDIVMEELKSFIRPGIFEYEVFAQIQKRLVKLGSEEQWIMLGSDAPGNKAPQLHSFYHNRKIKEGDQIFVMIEGNGPGGYYAEIGRTFSLGEPPKELLQAWDVALQAQKLVFSMLKPGATPADILKANNDFLVSQGYPPEGRLFAHGQGYDLVERPALVTEEPMILKEGMYLAVHPAATNNKAHAFCCDNFLITEKGAEILTKTPQKIMII
jgi:Xaa-Pro aminopeptidase